jgi:hypothetical protein
MPDLIGRNRGHVAAPYFAGGDLTGGDQFAQPCTRFGVEVGVQYAAHLPPFALALKHARPRVQPLTTAPCNWQSPAL